MTPNTTSAPAPAPTITPQGIVVSVVAARRERQDPSFYRLRRGSQLLDGMLDSAFAEALQRLHHAGFKWVRHDNLACALLLAARIEGSHKQSLGEALSKASFSELRFGQLLAADEPAEVFQHLQRAVRFVEGRVSVFDVVRAALEWTPHGADKLRKRLICQYHALPEAELAAA